MTSIIKALDQAMNMPALFDSAFPTKLLRDAGSWDSFYTTEVFPFDIKVKKDKNGDTEYTQLIFAVAGISKEDISVKVEYDRLIVSINQTNQVEDESIEYIRRGLSHRSMSKTFYLRGIEPEDIQSTLENGLLTITLPSTEKTRGKLIDIKVK